MATIRGVLRDAARRANPAFAVGVAACSFVIVAYAQLIAPVVQQRYLHLTAGLLWTGSNVLLGVVIRPAVARLDPRTRAAFYRALTPRLVFYLPALLVTVISIGLPLSLRMRLFPHAEPWLTLYAFGNLVGVLLIFGWRFDAWTDRRWLAALTVGGSTTLTGVATTIGEFQPTSTSMSLTLLVGTLITLVGLGFILSGDLRACYELQTDDPDFDTIAALGQQNASLARVQILLQIAIVISVL